MNILERAGFPVLIRITANKNETQLRFFPCAALQHFPIDFNQFCSTPSNELRAARAAAGCHVGAGRGAGPGGHQQSIGA